MQSAAWGVKSPSAQGTVWERAHWLPSDLPRSVRLVDDIVSEYCLFRRLFPAPNGDHEPERATDHVALEEGHSERSIGDMMCCKGRPRGGDGGGGGRGSREGALGAGERGGDAWRWVGEESMAKGAVLSRVRRLVEAGDFLGEKRRGIRQKRTSFVVMGRKRERGSRAQYQVAGPTAASNPVQ